MDERFGKKYKLCSKRIIELIFAEGIVEKKSPFVLRYIKTELIEDVNFQIAISVPKRNFKRAVDRNRIKRVIREAVRKNKYILEKQHFSNPQKLALFLIYTSQKEESYQKMVDKIEVLFQRLISDKE